MHNPVTWIGGWSFNLACWRSHLVNLYPGREHTFLDAHAILQEPGLLAREAQKLPPGGILVGWSLGSLLLHQGLAEGTILPTCRFLSLSPIFDFCREGGPWTPAALFRMARKLPVKRDLVLDDFFSLVRGESHVSPEQREAWQKQGENYSLDALLQGLETLGGCRIPLNAIPAKATITYLASMHDPLAPPLPGDISRLGWLTYPKGHLPFLDYPDLLRPLLKSSNGIQRRNQENPI